MRRGFNKLKVRLARKHPKSATISPTQRKSENDKVASLCQDCQKAGPIIETKYHIVDQLPDLPKLQASSRSGCKLCGLIRDGILSDDAKRAMKKSLGGEKTSHFITGNISISITYIWNHISGSRCSGLDGASVEVRFEELEYDGLLQMTFLAEAVPDEPEIASLLGIAPSMQKFIDTESILWMKDRLEACLDHRHDQLGQDFIPERLLDVSDDCPRLVSRDDLLRQNKHDIKYAALSYCWGPSKDALTQLKATKKKLPQLIKGIDEKEMTAIIRDAVTTTRALSIPYLWVDALCILQDNATEWEHQCADMDKIYGRAHVTLRATSARSCHEGFLQQKGTRIRLPFSSFLRPNMSGSYYLQLKRIGKERMFNVYYTDQVQSPLRQRGWAYQEDVLSTRQIVFGASNIHFQCSRGTFSRGIEGPIVTETVRTAGLTNTLNPDLLYNQWTSILKAYSRYTEDSFTKASDILPALSGLAALYGNRLKDEYLVGHWKGDLPQTLLWRRLGVGPKAQDQTAHSPNLYIAPSWSILGKGATSWATDFSIFHNFEPDVEHINGIAIPKGENPLGNVSSAQMEIRSYVLRLDAPRQFPGTLAMSRKAIHRGIWSVMFGKEGSLFCCLDYEYADEETCKRLISRATWVLLGSVTKVASAASLRCGLGLLLIPAPIFGNFYRIGVFYPSPEVYQEEEPKEQVMGVPTFKQLAEVETILVV